jgi:uncharacterized membrane protein
MRVTSILIGIIILWSGYITYRDSWDHLYGFPVPRLTGVFIGIVGIVFIIAGILHKNITKNGNKENNKSK